MHKTGPAGIESEHMTAVRHETTIIDTQNVGSDFQLDWRSVSLVPINWWASCCFVFLQHGFTPLYMAAQENHINVVRFLLSRDARQDITTAVSALALAIVIVLLMLIYTYYRAFVIL